MTRSPWQAGALLLLTACVTQTAQTPAEMPVVVAEPAPAVVEVVIAPPPAAEPVVMETETEIVIEESAVAALPPPQSVPEPALEPEPATPAPAPEIDDDPAQLMGLVGADLADLLGEPGYRREDADAQVWQYRGIDCLLDVYLYRDGDGTPHRVTYYEFRGDNDDRPCLRDLLLANN